MRIILDLPDDQVEALKRFCERERISRAEAVRRAVSSMLAETEVSRRRAILEETFGAWAPADFDARAYVDEIRAEWDERERRIGL